MTKASTTAKVMAVPDAAMATGAIVFWKLTEAKIDKGALAFAWADRGLDPKDAPRGATPAKALRRAMRDQAGRHRLSRRVGRGAFALVDERGANDVHADPEYGVRARAELTRDADGVPIVSIRSHDESLRGDVASAYARHLDVVSPRDVSWWLSSSLMFDLQAVALRDAGGVYFIPAASLPRFDEVARILKELGRHVLHQIPALQTEDAVAAILDGLASETDAALTALRTELAEGDLGGRALASRARLCAAIGDKLATYEGVLGRGLEDLRGRLADVEANVAAATLAAQVDEEVAS